MFYIYIYVFYCENDDCAFVGGSPCVEEGSHGGRVNALKKARKSCILIYHDLSHLTQGRIEMSGMNYKMPAMSQRSQDGPCWEADGRKGA